MSQNRLVTEDARSESDSCFAVRDADQARYAFDHACAGSETLLAGVDEAGRGPLAGPVVACAVIFKPDAPLFPVNDSKALSSSLRERLYAQLLMHTDYGIGVSDEATIDQFNIYQATRLAMRQAVLALTRKPGLVLIDGNMKLDIPYRQAAVVKGDLKSAVIAAASIIAKVYRDAWMLRLDQTFPQYGFAEHKGYATPQHLLNLTTFGPSAVHRRSFAPVREHFQKVLL